MEISADGGFVLLLELTRNVMLQQCGLRDNSSFISIDYILDFCEIIDLYTVHTTGKAAKSTHTFPTADCPIMIIFTSTFLVPDPPDDAIFTFYLSILYNLCLLPREDEIRFKNVETTSFSNYQSKESFTFESIPPY